MPDNNTMFELFAYGTLMVPAIVSRVLGRKIDDLTFQDAILHGFSRHHITARDYPAIIEAGKLGAADACVRGTLISGLSEQDMRLLDIFEADEYVRKEVTAVLLGSPSSATAYVSGSADNETGKTSAQAYIWADHLASLLDPKEWSFESFLRDKADAWANGKQWEFDAVEAARQPSEGADEVLEGQKVEGYPEFGRGMRKFWKFKEGYINLNHGSYGSPPVPVLDARLRVSDEIEGAPDLWLRRKSESSLLAARQAVAPILGCDEKDMVLVPNATHGINNILSSIDWADGDIAVCYGSTYNAVAAGLKYVCDRNAGVRLEVIPVTFPEMTHRDVADATRAMFEKYNAHLSPDYSALQGGKEGKERVRLVVVDSIASAPGVKYPWEEVVRAAREYKVLSLVDGAHSIGQQPLSVAKADPDFFVTNCHKWLMSHRGGAAMYVPKRNQELIRASFPVGHYYESKRYPTVGGGHDWAWQKQYDWNGTIDFCPIVTIKDAIQFRKDIGGEERIIAYTHDLAVKGGARLAERWGTQVMDNDDGELTAAMVNVRLPLPPPSTKNAELAAFSRFLEDQMLFEYNCAAAVYPHNGHWWTRLSAQVWNDLSDFDYIGKMFEEIKEKVERGEHRNANL